MSHDKNSQMRYLIRATLQKNFLCVLNLTACVIFLGLINGVAYTEALRRMTQAVWEREWSGFLHALCGFGAVLLCSLILNIGKKRKTERIGPQPGSIRAVLFLWNRAADSEENGNEAGRNRLFRVGRKLGMRVFLPLREECDCFME